MLRNTKAHRSKSPSRWHGTCLAALLRQLHSMQRLRKIYEEGARVAVQPPLWTRHRVKHNSALLTFGTGCHAHAHEAVGAPGVRAQRARHACLPACALATHLQPSCISHHAYTSKALIAPLTCHALEKMVCTATASSGQSVAQGCAPAGPCVMGISAVTPFNRTSQLRKQGV